MNLASNTCTVKYSGGKYLEEFHMPNKIKYYIYIYFKSYSVNNTCINLLTVICNFCYSQLIDLCLTADNTYPSKFSNYNKQILGPKL